VETKGADLAVAMEDSRLSKKEGGESRRPLLIGEKSRAIDTSLHIGPL